jgi:hypothetical protein
MHDAFLSIMSIHGLTAEGGTASVTRASSSRKVAAAKKTPLG